MQVNKNPQADDIFYPDSDGKPMADNTIQFRWISKLKGATEFLFRSDNQVFVAGDLLWYPVKGDPKTRVAPDVMVVFGRPKGDRGSYKQWEEEGIAPQVVVEVLSPSNTVGEMNDKQKFYYDHGVEEFYILDPITESLWIWQKDEAIAMLYPQKKEAWVSKRLGIKFAVLEGKLQAFYPDDSPILTYDETKQQALEQQRLAEEHKQQAEAERKAKEDALAEIERLKAELHKRSQ
ncbi:MAG: Uma2 family endonuclease [Bacteroidota bacterium]